MPVSNTTDRVREFMRFFFGDYLWLEGMTGVKASKWRDLDRGRTKAVTAEMIDELCRCWPEFAYWFVTGQAVSDRGQASPVDYLEFNYETVRFLEPGDVEFWRDESGELCGTEGLMNIDKRSEKYELSVASRVLEGSGSTNYDDARKLAPQFRDAFLVPLANGQKLKMAGKDIKRWVNQFQIGTRSKNA